MFKDERRLALGILAVTAAVQTGLFAGLFAGQRQYTFANQASITAVVGEGIVIRGDGLGYYAWLRSLLFDGDWSFENEFDEHNAFHSWLPGPTMVTPIGRRWNHWPVGPACAWAVTVAPGHLILTHGIGGRWATVTGYETPYQFMVGATSLLLSITGTGFMYAACRRLTRPVPAALGAAFMSLGTSVLYYGSLEGSMAHGPAAAALAVYLWYWLRTYGSDRILRWWMTGFLLGVVALMRWQLATYGLLVAGEAVLVAPFGRRAVGRLALIGFGSLLTFWPQLAAWKCVFGSWLPSLHPLEHNWLMPRLWEVLGSTDRSLFYWTPLAAVGFIGFGHVRGRAPIAWLGLAFAAQAYFYAAVTGPGVSLGASFGCRSLSESCVGLAPPLALLLDNAPRTRFRWLTILGSSLVLWNLLLIAAYRSLLVPADAGAGPAQLLGALIHLCHLRPLTVLVQTIAPVTIVALALKARPASRPAALKMLSFPTDKSRAA
jgi:hypothetical protein